MRGVARRAFVLVLQRQGRHGGVLASCESQSRCVGWSPGRSGDRGMAPAPARPCTAVPMSTCRAGHAEGRAGACPSPLLAGRGARRRCRRGGSGPRREQQRRGCASCLSPVRRCDGWSGEGRVAGSSVHWRQHRCAVAKGCWVCLRPAAGCLCCRARPTRRRPPAAAALHQGLPHGPGPFRHTFYWCSACKVR